MHELVINTGFINERVEEVYKAIMNDKHLERTAINVIKNYKYVEDKLKMLDNLTNYTVKRKKIIASCDDIDEAVLAICNDLHFICGEEIINKPSNKEKKMPEVTTAKELKNMVLNDYDLMLQGIKIVFETQSTKEAQEDMYCLVERMCEPENINTEYREMSAAAVQIVNEIGTFCEWEGK